jgi:hypothetical protein
MERPCCDDAEHALLPELPQPLIDTISLAMTQVCWHPTLAVLVKDQ